jgi:hypothetical protein
MPGVLRDAATCVVRSTDYAAGGLEAGLPRFHLSGNAGALYGGSRPPPLFLARRVILTAARLHLN